MLLGRADSHAGHFLPDGCRLARQLTCGGAVAASIAWMQAHRHPTDLTEQQQVQASPGLAVPACSAHSVWSGGLCELFANALFIWVWVWLIMLAHARIIAVWLADQA